jgi:hypothetical protein
VRRLLLFILSVAFLSLACSPANPAAPSPLSGAGSSEARGTKPVNVNGVVENMIGGAGEFQFNVGIVLVKGDSTTEFFGGSDYAHLGNGTRVEVKGQQQDGWVQALRIHVNSRVVQEPPDAGDPEDPPDVPGGDIPPACSWPDGGGGGGDVNPSTLNIEVIITTVSGSSPTMTVVGGNRTFRTTAATRLRRNDDWLPLEILRPNLIARFYGNQLADISIDTTEIIITRNTLDVAMEGAVVAVTGEYPSAQFTIDTTTFVANDWTKFATPACDALTVGAGLRVRGVRMIDGVSVLATAVERIF